jgi:hypothetical protein
VLRENSVPVPQCLPRIPNRLTWDLTTSNIALACTVGVSMWVQTDDVITYDTFCKLNKKYCKCLNQKYPEQHMNQNGNLEILRNKNEIQCLVLKFLTRNYNTNRINLQGTTHQLHSEVLIPVSFAPSSTPVTPKAFQSSFHPFQIMKN